MEGTVFIRRVQVSKQGQYRTTIPKQIAHSMELNPEGDYLDFTFFNKTHVVIRKHVELQQENKAREGGGDNGNNG